MAKKAIFGITVLIVGLALICGFTACENPAGGGGGGDDGGTPPPAAVQKTPITSAEITIGAPAKGITPSATGSTEGNFTIGVTWSPAVDDKFLGNTIYTATVTLTANSGYIFSELDSVTMNGKAVPVTNNTGATVTLSHTFPETADREVVSIAVKSQPTTLGYMHGNVFYEFRLLGLVVTLTYDNNEVKNVEYTDFAANNITTSPAPGTTLDRSLHDGKPITITYGNLTCSTKNLTVVAATISSTQIDIVAPVKGETPDTMASGTGNFSIGQVTWLPNDSPFRANVRYTATVTLTANENYAFSSINSLSVTLNGSSQNQQMTISDNIRTAVTVSYTFPETANKDVTSIALKSQPTKLTYTHGDLFDLSGLEVTLTYEDDTTEDVAAAEFASKNIMASLAQNEQLVRSTHNGKPVTITYGSLTCSTNNLTVNKAAGTFSPHVAINTTYTPSLMLNNLNSQLQSGYAWVTPSTSLNASNGQTFAATYTDPSENYEVASGFITVNVAKATGAAVDTPILNSTTQDSITINAVPAPTNGQTVEYAINVTNTIPTTGWQTGLTFSELSVGTTYYIFSRSAENENYNVGTASASLQVTLIFEITFSNLVADGSATATTTNLTLTFSGDITDLTEADITLSAGSIGAVKGVLTRTGTGVYKLTVSGIIASGTVTVSVSKSGYVITGNSKSVPVYRNTTFTDIDAMADYIRELPNNTIDTPYAIKLNVTSLPNGSNSSSSYSALQNALMITNKYVNLDLSGSIFTSIEEWAFYYCSSLVNITIPGSVTTIGDYVFRNCSSLTVLNVDASNTTYSSDGGVLYNKNKTTLVQYPVGKTDSSYTIPNSVTNIGNYAFSDCSNLTSITIPDSITNIGNYAFSYCRNLTNITIPDSVTNIGNNAFDSCHELTSVTMPNSVTSIGDGAFRFCESLTSVTIPNSVTSIGNYAFFTCINLTSVTIPNSVISIGDYAFQHCEKLSSVTFQGLITAADFSDYNPFNGNLRDTYLTGGRGTYKTTTASTLWNTATWIKQ